MISNPKCFNKSLNLNLIASSLQFFRSLKKIAIVPHTYSKPKINIINQNNVPLICYYKTTTEIEEVSQINKIKTTTTKQQQKRLLNSYLPVQQEQLQKQQIYMWKKIIAINIIM